LVDPKQLAQLVGAFQDNEVDIATLGTSQIAEGELEDDNRIKVVTDYKGDALYFSRNKIPFERNENGYPYMRHIGLYGFRCATLNKLIDSPATKLEEVESLEQLRWLYYGYSIRVVESDIETPNIDVPEDVDHVLKVMKNQLREE
jgi:3-deoxy-manno-octulosonate cytidylyltransferase (CMP-KDO synthetase)